MENGGDNATASGETLQSFAGRVETKDRTHVNNRIQLPAVAAAIAVPLLIWWGLSVFSSVGKPAARPTSTARVVTSVPAGAPPMISFTPSTVPLPSSTVTPSPTVTPSRTLTRTFTPSKTATFTSTPIVGEFWLSLRMAPVRGKTQSGIMAQDVWGRGAACPDRFPLGAELLTVEGLRVLCVDRAATVKCVDSVCQVIVYGSGSLKGLVPARRVK